MSATTKNTRNFSWSLSFVTTFYTLGTLRWWQIGTCGEPHSWYWVLGVWPWSFPYHYTSMLQASSTSTWQTRASSRVASLLSEWIPREAFLVLKSFKSVSVLRDLFCTPASLLSLFPLWSSDFFSWSSSTRRNNSRTRGWKCKSNTNLS